MACARRRRASRRCRRRANWIQGRGRLPAADSGLLTAAVAADMTKRGRSANDGKSWKCGCGNVNKPTRHRFFKLPAFKCSQCQAELKLDFKFCLGEIEANGKSVVGEVWDQGKDPYCVAFAYGKAVEIVERVDNITKGLDPDTVVLVDPYDLEERFEQKFPTAHSVDSDITKVGTNTVMHMGLILRSEGIGRRKSHVKYIADDVSTIPSDNFETICQSLADGVPLVATYWAGKRRSRLGYCKIYVSPDEKEYKEKNSPHIGHAVVLIGAGMEKGRRFFYFLNSWGKKFCPRKNKSGQIVRGGIGKIQEEDLTKNVVKLSQHNESGGVRSLEDQSELEMNSINRILMKATLRQFSAEKFQQLRLKKDQNPDGGIFIDDDGVFSDDEGGFPQTSCAMYQASTYEVMITLRFIWILLCRNRDEDPVWAAGSGCEDTASFEEVAAELYALRLGLATKKAHDKAHDLSSEMLNGNCACNLVIACLLEAVEHH